MNRREFLLLTGATALSPFLASEETFYARNKHLAGRCIDVRSYKPRHDGEHPAFYGQCFERDNNLYVRSAKGVFGPIDPRDTVIKF